MASGKNAVAEAAEAHPEESSAQEITQELVEQVIRKVTTGSHPVAGLPAGKNPVLDRIGLQVGKTFIPASLLALFFGGPLTLVSWDTVNRIWNGPEEINQVRLEQCLDQQANIAFFSAVADKLQIEEKPKLPRRCRKLLEAYEEEGE